MWEDNACMNNCWGGRPWGGTASEEDASPSKDKSFDEGEVVDKEENPEGNLLRRECLKEELIKEEDPEEESIEKEDPKEGLSEAE